MRSRRVALASVAVFTILCVVGVSILAVAAGGSALAYEVNGTRMSQHLHLRGFTGRPAAIGAWLSAHAVNPALQPVLSCIPALTLAASYASGDGYAYRSAFRGASSVRSSRRGPVRAFTSCSSS